MVRATDRQEVRVAPGVWVVKTSTLHFSPCFAENKVLEVAGHLPETYAALNELAPWRKGKWPTKVECMSHGEIIRGRKKGAGHGFTLLDDDSTVYLNAHMTPTGIWLVTIHEFLHHGFPDAQESEINCELLPWVFKHVFGKTLTPEYGRRHGLGSPVPGVGDRSYCR